MSVLSPPLSVITLPSVGHSGDRREGGWAGRACGWGGAHTVGVAWAQPPAGHTGPWRSRVGRPRHPSPMCESCRGPGCPPVATHRPGPWKGKAPLFTRLPLSSVTQGPYPRAPLPSASAPESTEALRAPEPAPSPAFWHLSRGSEWHVCSLVSVVGDFFWHVLYYVLLRLSADLAFSDSFILTSGLCLPSGFHWPLGPLNRPLARPRGTLEWLCVVQRTLGVTLPTRRVAAVRAPWSAVSEAKVGFLSSAWGRGVTYADRRAGRLFPACWLRVSP